MITTRFQFSPSWLKNNDDNDNEVQRPCETDVFEYFITILFLHLFLVVRCKTFLSFDVCLIKVGE